MSFFFNTSTTPEIYTLSLHDALPIYANDSELAQAVKQYGEAIRELAANNIFPGDMLFKNFGLTRLGRLVFYDYDEIQTMTEMNFRVIPEPPNAEAEMASEPWYPVAANDVFPEEFEWFLRSEEHTSELQSRGHLVCRLLIEYNIRL